MLVGRTHWLLVKPFSTGISAPPRTSRYVQLRPETRNRCGWNGGAAPDSFRQRRSDRTDRLIARSDYEQAFRKARHCISIWPRWLSAYAIEREDV